MDGPASISGLQFANRMYASDDRQTLPGTSRRCRRRIMDQRSRCGPQRHQAARGLTALVTPSRSARLAVLSGRSDGPPSRHVALGVDEGSGCAVPLLRFPREAPRRSFRAHGATSGSGCRLQRADRYAARGGCRSGHRTPLFGALSRRHGENHRVGVTLAARSDSGGELKLDRLVRTQTYAWPSPEGPRGHTGHGNEAQVAAGGSG